MARSLQEQLDAGEPEPWEPEAGDSVLGEIEAISTREGDWGPYTVVTLLDSNGDAWNVACWDTVCKNKVEELAPEVGDMIGFKFLGEKANKSGSATYKNWSVKLARAAAPASESVEVADGFDDSEDI